MADAEKVIKGLTLCDVGSDGYCYEKECPYYQDECMCGLKNDTLSLLKEQEPVKLKQPTPDPFWLCGNCEAIIENKLYRYCPYCGRKIKDE